MKYLSLLFFVPSLAFAISSSLNVPDCQPLAKESCFEFRGRAADYMGRAGTRIWRIGTKRMYEVQKQSEEAASSLQVVDFHHNLFAKFKVCPLEESKPGAMQGVCVQSVKGARVKKLKD